MEFQFFGREVSSGNRGRGFVGGFVLMRDASIHPRDGANQQQNQSHKRNDRDRSFSFAGLRRHGFPLVHNKAMIGNIQRTCMHRSFHICNRPASSCRAKPGRSINREPIIRFLISCRRPAKSAGSMASEIAIFT